ncbi:type II toxin-antitoxin system ParD family antitoxin [[Phormidium] sp. LEGE 05292]|uniref:type II toxin-antitoxin system ParD family antitoxin n=1 Tax=[Phormidium] sp. LEGE 05292 TaxID=767427 RepID=UPI001D151AE4|nr:type II toxin-antitoxin system ParD family antitoxin [Phormidium sp. LEGE 05292]
MYGLTEQEAIEKVNALALKLINNELAATQLVELIKKIAQGEEQIRQGKVVDGEVVFQQLQEKLEQMKS